MALPHGFAIGHGCSSSVTKMTSDRLGYRPENRYVVFQALPSTVGLATGHWRVLAKAHERRNLAEYEGYLEPDERLLADALAASDFNFGVLREDAGDTEVYTLLLIAHSIYDRLWER